jgi:uncharacterized protein involved in exopolysaccharide biosynthesis
VRRTLEAIFRHPLELLFLLVALPIIGVAIAYFLIPRTYQSTASLWALQRYYVIGATGPESDLNSTPAQTQATALSELLQTHEFTQAVSQDVPIVSTLGLSSDANPQQVEDAIYTNLSTRVTATPVAYNLLEINYTSTNPRVAQQVVQSVIATFGSQSLILSKIEGQNLIASYQAQLPSAQKDLNDAVAAETQYIQTHSSLNLAQLANDPEYSLLDSKRLQAQSNVQNIESTINSIKQSINTQGTGANALFQVIDAPQVPVRPVSRTKDYLVAGGAGLAIALLGWAVYLIIAVRRDRGVYTAQDLEHLVAFPVVMQLPTLTKSTLSLATKGVKPGPALLTGGKNNANGHSAR